MTGPANHSPAPNSPSRPSRLPWLIAIAVAMSVVAYGIRPTAAISGSGPAVGQLAPSLQLVSLASARPHTVEPATDSPASRVFDSQLTLITFDQPQVTMIHFWGTWCGPCRHELPELALLHQEIKSHPRFRLLAITCASFDDPSLTTLANRTSQFYKSAQIDLPTYADPTTTARRQFVSLMQGQGMAYPTTILIDSQGIIQATWVGVPPGGVETIRKRVNELLADCP